MMQEMTLTSKLFTAFIVVTPLVSRPTSNDYRLEYFYTVCSNIPFHFMTHSIFLWSVLV